VSRFWIILTLLVALDRYLAWSTPVVVASALDDQQPRISVVTPVPMTSDEALLDIQDEAYLDLQSEVEADLAMNFSPLQQTQ